MFQLNVNRNYNIKQRKLAAGSLFGNLCQRFENATKTHHKHLTLFEITKVPKFDFLNLLTADGLKRSPDITQAHVGVVAELAQPMAMLVRTPSDSSAHDS